MSSAPRKVTAYIGLVALAMITVAPLAYMLLLACLPQASFISTQSLWEAVRNGLTSENFTAAIDRAQIVNRLGVSFTLSALVLALVAAMGLPAAYAISRLSRDQAIDISFCFLSTRILPGVAVSVPIFLIFNRSEMIPPFAALTFVFVGLNLPVLIWLTVPVFRTVSRQLEETLMLDGLSHASILGVVVLPLVGKRLVAVLAIVFLLVWNETFFSSVFRVDTITEVIPSLISHRGVQWGTVMAVGTIASAPLLVAVPVLVVVRWAFEQRAR